jgi:hypothetical protein
MKVGRGIKYADPRLFEYPPEVQEELNRWRCELLGYDWIAKRQKIVEPKTLWERIKWGIKRRFKLYSPTSI